MRRALIFLLILTLLPLCAGCAAADEGAGTQLIALNIGKADCLLLQTQGKAYLIDTGWERTSAAMLELLRRNGVTHLDGVFLPTATETITAACRRWRNAISRWTPGTPRPSIMIFQAPAIP